MTVLPSDFFDSDAYRRPWHVSADRLPIRCGSDHDLRDRHLCGECAGVLHELLYDIPALVCDARLAITRQTHFVEHGSRTDSIGGDTSSPLPFDYRASAALAELTALLGAAGAHGSPEASSRWHLHHFDLTLMRPDVADWVGRLSAAVAHVHAVIDRPADPWYYGPCPNCGHDIYDERDVEHVACHHCDDYAAPIADHQLACLDAGEDRMLTVTELVGAITSAGETVTRHQINGWIRRDGLPREQQNRVVWKAGRLASETVYVYRLGDVRRLALEADIKRAG